jgi:tetratricopeptide (TPR) repeat protein
MVALFGFKIPIEIFWGVLGVVIAVVGLLITLFAWILPRRSRLIREEEEHLKVIERKAEDAVKKAELANKNIENIEIHFGIPIYADGLSAAQPPVFDPFLEGTNRMNQYQWNKAIEEFKKSIKEAKGNELVGLFNLIGNCHHHLGKLSEALENYEMSLRLAKQYDDKKGEAAATGNIGIIYQTKGDFDQALKYHGEALKIDRDIGNKKGEGWDINRIGMIYQVKGDLNEAMKYHEAALKIMQEIGNRRDEGTIIGNIGAVYWKKEDFDNALKYFEDSLKIGQETGKKEEVARQFGNIGVVYFNKGDLDKALKYHEENLKVAQEIGSKESEAAALGNIGLTYAQKGEKVKGLNYLNQALEIYKQIGAKIEIEMVENYIRDLKEK